MTIHKLVFKHSNGDAAEYVGHHEGEIFYNDQDRIIRITDGNTPGGIVIGYGTGADIPQIIVNDDSHDLLLADHGKHVYLINQSEVIIDNAINDALPIGYTVVLITDGTEGWVYNIDTGDIDVYGAGMDATAEYWAIPAHSMGTLIKTGDSRWMFSGAGLYDDS